ncbi:MAG TPA: response regulator [Anaeromyxobacteraceae bacterium]
MRAAATRGEVMLVEDDLAIRETLRELLEGEGYGVQSAENGRDALARLRTSEPPRLILLDLTMPVMDGWAFRRAQRRDPALSRIPVVVLSADHPLAEKVSDMAVAGYLAKPFELAALLDTVQRYC